MNYYFQVSQVHDDESMIVLRTQLILEELTTVFHDISKSLYKFVIPEGEDEWVQKRGHH